jgi:hypothetical protein
LPTSISLDVGQSLDLLDEISIDFPSMPDTIELARRAEYAVSPANIVLPDGVHMYKGTLPLEIPFSFKLHAFDQEFCPNGALTLLQLAARLHSFALPISSTSKQTTYAGYGSEGPPPKAGDPPKPVMSEEQIHQSQAQQLGSGDLRTNLTSGNVFNPVTCVLELIYTSAYLPGISCVGYIKEVSAKLAGPWLRGPGKSFNLPSSGDFSFTFVHRPGHGNVFDNQQTMKSTAQPQAYADYVAQHLYNTRSLVQVANYRGLSNTPASLKDAQGQRVTQLRAGQLPQPAVSQTTQSPTVDSELAKEGIAPEAASKQSTRTVANPFFPAFKQSN